MCDRATPAPRSPLPPPPPQPPPRPPPAGALTMLGITVVILGINWPIMKQGLESIDPLWFAFMRVTAAGVVVTAVAMAMGRLRPPPRQDWPVVLSVGLAGTGIHLAILFTALQYVPAGRSSVLVWTAALWTVPIASVALQERMSPRRWGGLIAGIVAYQAVLATGFSAWSRQIVVLSLRATTVSLVMMAIPLVGIVASVVALDERVTIAAAIGVAAIGIGVAMSVLAERVDPVALEAQPLD